MTPCATSLLDLLGVPALRGHLGDLASCDLWTVFAGATCKDAEQLLRYRRRGDALGFMQLLAAQADTLQERAMEVHLAHQMDALLQRQARVGLRWRCGTPTSSSTSS